MNKKLKLSDFVFDHRAYKMIDEMIEQAVVKEREAIAKMIDEICDRCAASSRARDDNPTLREVASMIRARGQ